LLNATAESRLSNSSFLLSSFPGDDDDGKPLEFIQVMKPFYEPGASEGKVLSNRTQSDFSLRTTEIASTPSAAVAT
jgi:hypothetical protein